VTDLAEAAFERLALDCESEGHALCSGTLECQLLLQQHRAHLDRKAAAAQFDAGRERASIRGQQPAHTWSTSALLRTATELLLRPPVNDVLWRSIAITTALARLGERGLSADAVVRTCIGPILIRRILGDTGLFWSAHRNSDIPQDQIPEVLRPWCRIFDAEDSLTGLVQPLATHAAYVAAMSSPGRLANSWLQTASVAHIADWRIENYLEVRRVPSDLVLSGGTDATRWVYERLATTYLNEWHVESLSWELIFNRDAEGAALAAGVSESILSERVTTNDLVIDALRQKLTAPQPFEELEPGLDANAAITSLGLMLEKGLIDGARSMARRLHEARPGDTFLAFAYAFCSIPTDPAGARNVLVGLDLGIALEMAALRAIDLATCALFEQDLLSARDAFGAGANPLPEHTAWLWDPVEASQGRAILQYGTLDSWAKRFAEIEPS